MTGFAIVSTTVGNHDEARSLAHALVEARLAACVQIVPIDSVYRWEGKVEAAKEHLLLCKISTAAYARIEAAIRQRHSYDVPEIVMTPITAGSAVYLGWIAASTSDPKQSGGTRMDAAAKG